MARRPSYLVLILLPLVLVNGCLFRSRSVDRRVSTAVLREATRDELVQRINQEAAKVKTLNATVDIAASVGGARKGKITDYQEIRGHVLVRKPSMLRMVGLFPIVRNRAFDMVSDGDGFRLSIPTKNKFITGSNEIVKPSPQPLENLRPQHIFDALLLREIDPQNEIAVLEAGTQVVQDLKTKKDVDESTYVIVVLQRGAGGWFLSRKIVFERTELEPRRQIVYDKMGNVATEATYGQFSSYGGVTFPSIVHIRRPQEEYSIILTIVKLRLNEPLKDEQFALKQPAGAQLVRLDAPRQNPGAGGNGDTPR